MREKLLLLSGFSSPFHRTLTISGSFAGLQRCVRSCSKMISAVWKYPTEKSRRFSIVFEAVKEAGWKRAVVRKRRGFRSGCFLSEGIRFHCFGGKIDMVSLDDELQHRRLSSKAIDKCVNLMMVVPAVSTSATPSEAAIDGAALKVKIQAVVGVGSWSRGYLVHLRDSCFAHSVLKVQPDTLDLSQLYRDMVNEIYVNNHHMLQRYEKLKWGSSQDDYNWNFFSGQPLEDKQEMALFCILFMNRNVTSPLFQIVHEPTEIQGGPSTPASPLGTGESVIADDPKGGHLQSE
ncbi:hypothetical protein V6N12_031515 [Hibiscus sabdariffa]|uniref:Uncharacterized protein n=1 Tax=Hibiscus sabdariffa TaxID=183260 RepID=A0ABR2CPG4_9ROSI